MILKVEDNNIYVFGYIYDGDGVRFLNEFSKIDGMYPEIEVWEHCYGGDVFAGNMMYNTVYNAKSVVNTTILGVGASMGAILSQAGKRRRMVSNGFIMIHEAVGGTYGTAADHLNSANLLTEMKKNFLRVLTQKTKKAVKEIKKWFVGDNWFSAEQALKEGLIDEIIDPQGILDIEIDDPKGHSLEEIYNRYAACLEIPKEISKKPTGSTSEVPIAKNLKDDYMKQDLINEFGLQGLTAQSSDTAVITAIKTHFSAQTASLQQQLDAERTAHNALKTSVDAAKDSQITALLDQAEKVDKKITAVERPTYQAIGQQSGIEALTTVLSKMGARQSLVSQIPGTASSSSIPQSRQGWNWDKYQKEDPRALEAMKRDDVEGFKALFKAKYNVDYVE